MSVNSIFGLPGILEILLEPRFLKKEFLAHNIKAKFVIDYKETTRTEIKSNQSNMTTTEADDQATIETKQQAIPVIPVQHSSISSFTDSAASVIQSASLADAYDIKNKV